MVMGKMPPSTWSMPPLLLLWLLVRFHAGYGQTNTIDVVALRSLSSDWKNVPPSWGAGDPCGKPWEGVICTNTRITTLKLSTMGIKGTLSGDIGELTGLETLDMSYNKELGGPLPRNIGNLKNLRILILPGCSFNGPIPSELGTLPLTYIALNSNKFTGNIPASLGALVDLYWLDIADNQVSGSLPISSDTSHGLDQLVKTKHFHFNKNNLSGPIPAKLFNSSMTLIHLLFDSNQFNGTIPETLGHVKTLETIRLDRNQLTGPIPSNFGNLSSANELILANNRLNGTIPDLSGMKSLNYLDLSNNTFDPSESPKWIAELQSLTTLVIESGRLQGQFQIAILKLYQLEKVSLKENSFNGTLDVTGSIGQQLKLVDLRNNSILNVAGNEYQFMLMLSGNPACNAATNVSYCMQLQTERAYSTNTSLCDSPSCPQNLLIPSTCACAYPYTGVMIFRAPSFSDLSNRTRFHSLERSLSTDLRLRAGYVSLSNLSFNSDNYLVVQVSLFPSKGKFFNRSEIQRLGFSLSNQTYKPPREFGTYFFIASQYLFEGSSNGSSKVSMGAIVGIVISGVLFIGLVCVAIYALWQKKRAKRATEPSRSYVSWSSGNDTSGAPQLKGARWFPFNDLKKFTSNFSEINEIGSGGYGKVYKGTLPNGQLVAIKRSQQGSSQGGLEFKTEIELLSRVHHKNVEGLIGFCFEQGEQMLVYEFITNGSLRENLAGKASTPLDWKRRLRITLGSARGLAYLHEFANPPIIHRDVKSGNILLDENLTAKVSDFGLSKLVADSEKGYVSTQVKGTMGYLDPEYYMTQQLTDKSDVYSLGVVMLELITSKPPIEKGKYIVREVKLALNKNDYKYHGLKEFIDPTIRSSDLVGFREFVDLALQCVLESATDRPTMNEVVKQIENILQSEGSDPTSTPSSSTDFGKPKDPPYPYSEQWPLRMVSSDAFDNSIGYSFSDKIQPK